MAKLNKTRLLFGIIFLFAGLDVTLLLSHMSRLIGVLFLLIGLFIILTSSQSYKQKLFDYIPRSIRKYLKYPKIKKVQLVVLILLILTSLLIFRGNTTLMIFATSLFLLSQIFAFILHNKNDFLDKEKNIHILIQFHLFAFFSTFIYFHFNDMIAYPDAPKLFSNIFLIGIWIVELLYLWEKGKSEDEIQEREEEAKEVIEEPLASKFINILTLDSRLVRYLPFLGILLVISVLSFNLFIKGSLDVGSHDGVAILFGVSLLVYNWIPETYKIERDFGVLFLFFLVMILVVPITIITYFTGGLTEHTNSPLIYHLLARPTAAILNLVGISAEADINVFGVTILMNTLKNGNISPNQLLLTIGLSCTGLYSVTTFISAFISFVLVNFSKFNWKLGTFLGLGIFMSWIANILRMTLIMVAGYYYGREALLWTHHNAGIFIFMVWVAIFWGLMFKFFDIPVRTD